VDGSLVEASKHQLRAYITLDGVQGAVRLQAGTRERRCGTFPTVTLARREVSAYLLAAPPAGLRTTDGAARRARSGRVPCQLWDRRAEDGEHCSAS